MKIVLSTPLYPPEIAPPAPYIKELAKRLAGRHEVTIVAYGRLPEQVPGVRIIAIDKRQPLVARLAAYTRALNRAAREADIIYAANGASFELPAILARLSLKTPLVIGIADPAARAHSAKSLPLRLIERIAMRHAHAIIEDMPLARPEINPLLPHPTAELGEYEASWEEHVRMLEGTFNHAK
jgi:hypothetical protein